jgi:hypothetical protein
MELRRVRSGAVFDLDGAEDADREQYGADDDAVADPPRLLAAPQRRLHHAAAADLLLVRRRSRRPEEHPPGPNLPRTRRPKRPPSVRPAARRKRSGAGQRFVQCKMEWGSVGTPPEAWGGQRGAGVGGGPPSLTGGNGQKAPEPRGWVGGGGGGPTSLIGGRRIFLNA